MADAPIEVRTSYYSLVSLKNHFLRIITKKPVPEQKENREKINLSEK